MEVQTTIFKFELSFTTVNYLADNLSENVYVLKSKFELVVF